jgi:putative phosphoesterase
VGADAARGLTMRAAALYDVHGNLPALEAVLADVDRETPEAIVCGGDLVSGPLASECLALLRERGAHFIKGNADRYVLESRDETDAWAHDRLSPDEREEVSAWPGTLRLEVEGLGRVLFCHASPRSDEEILTVATPEDVVTEAVAGASADVVVCGHTHQQFDRVADGVRLVNAGSVGLPYEGRAGAYWALLGPDVELRRTEYDVQEGVARLQEVGLPRLLDYLGPSLLDPLPREEVVATHERNAGRGA